MNVAAFDAWRDHYDSMSYADQVDFYNQVEAAHPKQRAFSAGRLVRFFRFVLASARPIAILEMGGWKGELARAVLGQFGAANINQWINYEISERARDANVCSDSRYTAIVPDDFMWNIDLPLAGVFVASHVIEHIKVSQLTALLDNLPLSVEYIALQAPITQSALAHDWSGYLGSHILEIGWRQVTDILIKRDFVPLSALSYRDFQAFVSGKSQALINYQKSRSVYKMKYEVLFSIWHTKDQKYYGEGDEVDLSHLNEQAREALVENGIVAPSTKLVAKPAATSKKDDRKSE